MCGLSAIIFKEHAKQDWTLLQKMAAHQHMRGPDDTQFFYEDNVGLAHNRLAVIDLSERGRQPMQSTQWALVYVGEIYNYKKFTDHGNDTYALLTLLHIVGFEETLKKINGMFAFAAWNFSEKKLYCAVDQLSIKQLFWYEDENVFAVASSPGALTHLKGKWEFDREALTDYLALGATMGPLFNGMHKLAAGNCLIYDAVAQISESHRWLQAEQQECSEEDILITTLESIQSVKEADVPVCMFLSGGIDSTVVGSQCPGMAAVHLASPEESYARQVAEKYGNPLEVVHPANYNARECLEDYSLQSGDCSMAALIPYIVSKEVSKTHKVAISSNGADELFFGYNRTQQRVTNEQINHIFRNHFFRKSNWYMRISGGDARSAELETYVTFDLNKTLDFASMCHGLEVRVPYLNLDVIEAALSLPRDKHVFGPITKTILKNFLELCGFDFKFLHRPKLGFSLFYEPEGHEDLKKDGVKMLKERFGIDPKFIRGSRDERYYESSAASFLCWLNVWGDKLLF